MKLTKLKPCPFCGGEARFRIISSGYASDGKTITFTAECPKCRISRGMGNNIIKYDKDLNVLYARDERQNVIEEWNERNQVIDT